jgi:hypothetical protein
MNWLVFLAKVEFTTTYIEYICCIAAGHLLVLN